MIHKFRINSGWKSWSYRSYWVVLLTLTIAYYLKSAEISITDFDPVLLSWLIIAATLTLSIRKKAIWLNIITYIFLLLPFLAGLKSIDFRTEDVALSRIFMSFVVLSSITSLYLTNKTPPLSKSLVPEIVLFVLLSGAIFFIYKEQTYIEYAIRAYGATNYLTLSDLIATLVLVTVFCRLSPKWLRGILIGAGLITCLLLGSRATMVALAAALIFGVAIAPTIRLRTKVAGVSGLFLIIISGTAFFLTNFDETATYRLLSFRDFSNDASAIARGQFLQDHIQTVRENSWCIVSPCFPPPGEYIHNALSIHQYFGLAGMFVFLFGLLVLLKALHIGWRPPALPLLIFCLMELFVARAWTSVIFPVTTGFMVAAFIFMMEHKKGSRKHEFFYK